MSEGAPDDSPAPAPESPAPAPESVIAEVLRLTGPAVLTSVLHTVVFLADRIMLGQHGATSLASMQISGSILWSVFNVFFGALVGTVALVSRRVGEDDLPAARTVAATALRISALIGIVVAGLVALGAGPIAAAMAPPPDAIGGEQARAAIEGAARSYMLMGSWCFPAVFVAACGAMILNGSGDTRTTFHIGLAVNAFNLAGDYLLIYGADLGPVHIPELGATGAALATSLAYVLDASLILWVLTRPNCPVRVRPATARLQAARELVRVGAPAIAERVVIHVGYVAFAAIVTVLGAVAMAANQAILTLESVAFLGAEGFGVAAATVVGQSLGRGRPEDAKRAGAFAALASAVVLGAFGLLTWATGQWTVPLFVAPGEDGSGLMALAALTLPILALEQPIMAAAMVLGHALRGAGDTRSPVVTAVVGGLVLRLSCSWLFAVTWGWGLRGIWLATALDWFVRTLILGAIFARGRWQTLQL